MTRIRVLAIVGLCLTLSMPLPLRAASTGGCESFDFPVATDLQWMRAADAEALTSGARLAAPPAKAMDVALKPVADVAFVRPPEGKTKDGEPAFGAVIELASVAMPGIYQVSLSAKGWIDVVQGGVALKTVAHSGKSDCEGLRKSVRFDMKDGPVTLQISGVTTSSIKITMRKAD